MNMFGLASSRAHGDIIYTWHEDDGQNVTGLLAVNSAAQSQGFFTPSMIDYFVFDVPGGGIGGPGTFPTFTEIPISTSNGGFTGVAGTQIGWSGDIGNGYVDTDLNYAVSGREMWYLDLITFPHPNVGDGHWTVSFGFVLEPSALTLAVIGLISIGGLKAISQFKRDRETTGGSRTGG